MATAWDDDDETGIGGLACAMKRTKSHGISLGVDSGFVADGDVVAGTPDDIPVLVDGMMTDVELLSFALRFSSATL